MINRTIQLEDVSAMPGANAPGTVNITCPRGYRYKDITLKLKRTDYAAVAVATTLGEIQVRMGGGIQRRADAARLDAINALNGAGYASQAYGAAFTAADPGERHLKIYFEEPWRTRIRNNSVDPNALGWKTGWLPNNKPMQLSLACLAAVGAGQTWNISAEASISDDDDGQPNPIIRWNSDFMNVNGSVVNLSNLDNGLQKTDRIEQISIFDGTTTAGTLANLRLEIGSIVVKQDQTLRSLISELINAGMAPATANAIANAAHIVFDKNDALDDTLPVGFISSLLKLTYSPTAAVGTIPYVTQIYGQPNHS